MKASQVTTPIKTQTAIGIDIGGTKMSSALVNTETGMQGFQEHPTPTDSGPFLDTLESMITALKTPDVIGVGIATAGIVDPTRGMILGATGNLPAVQGIPSIRQALEDRTGLKVYVENDANAAAYGEAKAGGAKGRSDVLMITLGTGVGTGIIIQGKILHGAHFSAGEGGHLVIALGKDRRCTCGRWNCWEAYASGTGFRETAHRMMKVAAPAQIANIMANFKTIDEVTSHGVVAAWKTGDALAAEILDAWHEHVAIGIGSLYNVLDPETVVVGGGMAQFVNFKRLEELTQQHAMPVVHLAPAQLGNQAGIVGAAYLALDHFGTSCP